MAPLPPGVSRRDFDSAVRLFEEAVGKDWVFTSEADLGPYRDAYATSWGEAAERRASAAVAPANVEQVQAVVRAANRYKVPLFPISTGKNFAYGGPAPNMTGTVVIDLKRMNKVLELDGDRHFALVEPGVSYLDLYKAIQDRGLKMWIDCPDPGWGSPMGNALDHGIGYTFGPYRDHFGSRCGMEVVLANGEVMRTGMGALPNSKSWQDYRYGYGPEVSGLFGQANFGIVTKMGFWLYPQPENYRTGTITVPKRADLHKLVHIVNYLEHSHLIGEPLFGTPMRALMKNADFRALVTKSGGPSDAEMDRYASDNNMHSWSLELQFYGPERTNLANWNYAKERFAAEIPGSRFIEGESLMTPVTEAQIDASPRRGVRHGVPSLDVWSIVTRTVDPTGNADGHIGFAPIIPRTAEAVFKAQRVFTDAFRTIETIFGADALTLPMAWNNRAFIFFTTLPTSRTKPEINHKTRDSMLKLIEIGAANGWGEYRAPPEFQDPIVGAYSFNNHVLRRFSEQLKDAVDPNGILAPGRGGIWPKHMRKARA